MILCSTFYIFPQLYIELDTLREKGRQQLFKCKRKYNLRKTEHDDKNKNMKYIPSFFAKKNYPLNYLLLAEDTDRRRYCSITCTTLFKVIQRPFALIPYSINSNISRNIISNL